MPMTPTQKIKWLILEKARKWGVDLPDITAENVDAVYKEKDEDDGLLDAFHEVRGGTVETDLPTQSSRHFEAKEVASQCPDGSWVGWTYWYGGGKHGEPASVDWMPDAYDVTMREETHVVQVFAKAEAA